jgi:hypothetical protein
MYLGLAIWTLYTQQVAWEGVFFVAISTVCGQSDRFAADVADGSSLLFK